MTEFNPDEELSQEEAIRLFLQRSNDELEVSCNQNGQGKWKTTETAKVLNDLLSIPRNDGQTYRVIYAVPTYEMLEGPKNLIAIWRSYNRSLTIFKGKSAFIPDKRDKRCYFPGCKDCPNFSNQVCAYWQQDVTAEVILTAYENVHKFKPLPNRIDILVIEECPERIYIKEHVVPEKLWGNLRLLQPTTIANRGHRYQFWIQVILQRPFQIRSVAHQQLNLFFGVYSRIIAYENKHQLILVGVKRQMIPNHIHKVIVNDATMPDLLAQMMFVDAKNILGATEPTPLQNPVLLIRGKWASKMIRTNFHNFYRFIVQVLRSIHQTDEHAKILLVTKLKVKDRLKVLLNRLNLLEMVDIVHFGECRGKNLSVDSPYALIIQYGTYHRRPVDYLKMQLLFPQLARMGFDVSQLVTTLDLAEGQQGIHRGRPYLHPEIPLILCVDQREWNDKFQGAVGKKVLKDFADYPSSLKDANSKKLREKGLNYEHITDLRRFLSFWEKNVLKQKAIEQIIMELRQQGWTIPQITAKVGKSLSTIKRTLRKISELDALNALQDYVDDACNKET